MIKTNNWHSYYKKATYKMAISIFEVKPKYIQQCNDIQIIADVLAQIDVYRCNPKTDKHFKCICSAIITNMYMHELFDKLDNKCKAVIMKLVKLFNNLTPHALNNVNLFRLLHKMNMLYLIDITGETLTKCTSKLTVIYIWENKLFEFGKTDVDFKNKNATFVVENEILHSSME